jgi:hypothetical protein
VICDLTPQELEILRIFRAFKLSRVSHEQRLREVLAALLTSDDVENEVEEVLVWNTSSRYTS